METVFKAAGKQIGNLPILYSTATFSEATYSLLLFLERL